jgi:aminopeptidase N
VFLAEHLGFSDKDLEARSALLRGRGPLVLHGVRDRLTARYGEEKGTNLFLTWIRSYVKNFTYRPANTRALIAILDQITGESWQAYFEQYFFGTDPSAVK